MFGKECHDTQKCLMILDVVKDKENYQKNFHEYKILIQRKKRIWEVKLQFLYTQENVNACGKFWINLNGKHVENYSNLALMHMYIHCTNLYA